MDVFAKFNRKNIQDRQIDTLIGLSKGVLADGTINQAEAEFLMGGHACGFAGIVILPDGHAKTGTDLF